jgi:hypothetical protein
VTILEQSYLTISVELAVPQRNLSSMWKLDIAANLAMQVRRNGNFEANSRWKSEAGHVGVMGQIIALDQRPLRFCFCYKHKNKQQLDSNMYC